MVVISPPSDLTRPVPPEAVVRALACCAALRKDEVTERHIKWVITQTEEYDYQDFWIPYGVWRGAYYMKPWASAALNYLNGRKLPPGYLATIEPTSFYNDIRAIAANARWSGVSHTDLQASAMQAYQQATVEGMRGIGLDSRAEELDMLYSLARQAADQGKLITDPRKLKRLMAA